METDGSVDNIYISHDPAQAKAFAEETFHVKKPIEQEAEGSAEPEEEDGEASSLVDKLRLKVYEFIRKFLSRCLPDMSSSLLRYRSGTVRHQAGRQANARDGRRSGRRPVHPCWHARFSVRSHRLKAYHRAFSGLPMPKTTPRLVLIFARSRRRRSRPLRPRMSSKSQCSPSQSRLSFLPEPPLPPSSPRSSMSRTAASRSGPRGAQRSRQSHAFGRQERETSACVAERRIMCVGRGKGHRRRRQCEIDKAYIDGL